LYSGAPVFESRSGYRFILIQDSRPVIVPLNKLPLAVLTFFPLVRYDNPASSSATRLA